MDNFQITGFNFVEGDCQGRPGFMVVNYKIRIVGEIEDTFHNIEGRVRLADSWPDSHADLEKLAKAEIKRVLAKAANLI